MNREDMLELTRRMTPSRTSMTRIAGAYMDPDGFPDDTFNTNFLKLKASDKEKNLALAKAIPFSETNVELKEYPFPKGCESPGGIWRLLMAIKQSGLKEDALLFTLYELIGEVFKPGKDYCIYLFHDRYDVPLKGKDKERQGESEEVYEYIICSICPLSGDYEPGAPMAGFLFPSFVDRSSDDHRIAIYDQKGDSPRRKELLGLFDIKG